LVGSEKEEPTSFYLGGLICDDEMRNKGEPERKF
jgi:hypothetical protein